MIRECEAGRINLIITKSVARFSRNIVDCIATVRKLKNLRPPVGVFFEAENMSTLDNASEMLLTILSLTAEEESRSKSEIMNVSVEQRFGRGLFLTPPLLGYDKVGKGMLAVNPEEAKTVLLFYYMLLGGYTAQEIADMAMELERPTKLGRLKWTRGSVVGVLRNERHCGDILAHKTFTPNFLDHKSRKNINERNKYWHRNHHEAIVPREVWNAAQKILDSMKYGLTGGYSPLCVIPGGALLGFLPINRAWAGAEANDYVSASRQAYEMAGQEPPLQEQDDEPGGKNDETRDPVPMSTYQVVRSELFSMRTNPAITIAPTKLSINAGCIRLLGDVEWAEFLWNPVERLLAIRPCEAGRPNALRLTRKKKTQCVFGFSSLAPLLYDHMGWDENYRYRLRAMRRRRDDEAVLLFDMDETMCAALPALKKDAARDEHVVGAHEAEGPDTREAPLAFGPSFAEHQASTRLPRIDLEGHWDVSACGTPVDTVPEVPEDVFAALTGATAANGPMPEAPTSPGFT